ncbi:MAG: class I SAM-dependent methyltransferase [Acetobacteraceae bacterium]|nr:class I SAM-dependent methyltransferase [Acetobacteraceae bacterium]
MIRDTPHTVTDETGRRWPAPDGIPFLRAGRAALAAEALARIDADDVDGARAALLADQDDWWRGPAADPAALRTLVRERARLSLRDAMALLAWGEVGDYFAHRWSDPTFVAGLALTEAHWNVPAEAFELACGIGHHLRALAQRGVRVTGADVVWAKLWVAHHWVVPGARLFCFDAAQDWPPVGSGFGLVACHDAFYFLAPKSPIVARLRALLDPATGVLIVGHIHNRDWPNLSAGHALSAGELADLFPDATMYDDAELTRALHERRAPQAASPDALGKAEAFSLASGPGLGGARAVTNGLALPPPGTALRLNPLYAANRRIAWPSERYAREYGPRATYPLTSDAPAAAVLDAATEEPARRRELLDLPAQW